MRKVIHAFFIVLFLDKVQCGHYLLQTALNTLIVKGFLLSITITGKKKMIDAGKYQSLKEEGKGRKCPQRIVDLRGIVETPRVMVPPTHQRVEEGEIVGDKGEMFQEMIIIMTRGTRMSGGAVVISIRVSQKKVVRRKRVVFQAISRGKFNWFGTVPTLFQLILTYHENLRKSK